MKGNLLKIQYETEGLGADQRLDDFLMMPRHKIVSKLILQYCTKDESILDVGCGSPCSQLLFLKNNGFAKLNGVDFNIRRQYEGINLYEQDLEDSLSLPKKYDNIIMADVLEHLRYPRAVLKNLLNVLDDNGRIFLCVPNAGHFLNGILLSLLPRHLNMSSAFGPWGHYYFFTYYSLKKLFTLFDLEIIERDGSALEFRYMSMHPIKRIAMWLLNIIPIALNYGIFRKYFSDHLYFILRKKNENYKEIPDQLIYEANV